MKNEVSVFLNMRKDILRNAIFNSLLLAHATKNTKPIIVGKTLRKLEGELRKLVKEKRGTEKRLPTYILVDVVVKLDWTFSIGYSYESYPIVWEKTFPRSGKTQISSLKLLAAFIYDNYAMHASKSDTIFSSIPKALKILLESNNISSNYWTTGFPKKLKPADIPIDENEVSKYGNLLARRLDDWQNFNKILVEIINTGRFDKSSSNGRLIVEKSEFSEMLLCYFKPYTPTSPSSTLIHYNDFTPPAWDKINPDVDIFMIRHAFFL